jgi:hypothetical protein
VLDFRDPFLRAELRRVGVELGGNLRISHSRVASYCVRTEPN